MAKLLLAFACIIVGVVLASESCENCGAPKSAVLLQIRASKGQGPKHLSAAEAAPTGIKSLLETTSYDESSYDEASYESAHDDHAEPSPSSYCGEEELQAGRIFYEGFTCDDPLLSEWMMSGEADAESETWVISQCCGAAIQSVKDGTCLCGDKNFYEGHPIAAWGEDRACGADENSWACAADLSAEQVAGRDYLAIICCGKMTYEEKARFDVSVKDGSCLCGDSPFLEGMLIADWDGRTCGERENSWACAAELSAEQVGGRDYMAGFCCGTVA